MSRKYYLKPSKIKIFKMLPISSLLPIFIYPGLGIVSWAFVVFTLIVFSPVFIYRYLLLKYFRVLFGRHFVSKPLTATSQCFASELTAPMRSSRCSIVVKLYLPGRVTSDQMRSSCLSGWVNSRDDNGRLKYPEFQQYISSWMGYTFWKNEENFSVDDHISLHTIPKQYEDKSDLILDNLTETFANKKFARGKSPWEMCFLSNYVKSGESMTVLIFRFHHGMADGYSIMFAAVEGILGQSMTGMEIAKPKYKRGYDLWKRLVYSPWRFLYDTGYLLKYVASGNTTPWHCPDGRKQWSQLYGKSREIPVEKVKLIKEKTGVSFTSVLLACFSAAATKNFKMKGFGNVKRFPVGIPLPLPGHPGKLENHLTAALIELPCDQALDPIKRLNVVEEIFQDARHNSQYPAIMWILLNILGSTPTLITRYLTNNFFNASAALTNFPGPGVPVRYQGNKCYGVDFCVGGASGTCGLTLSVLSYNSHVRFSVTVEESVMTRPDLDDFIHDLEQEINVLCDYGQKA